MELIGPAEGEPGAISLRGAEVYFWVTLSKPSTKCALAGCSGVFATEAMGRLVLCQES